MLCLKAIPPFASICQPTVDDDKTEFTSTEEGGSKVRTELLGPRGMLCFQQETRYRAEKVYV